MNTAIIFGVTGVSGRALAEHLLAIGGWRVVGTSRRAPENLPGVEHLAVDLDDRSAMATALVGVAPTHAFYCAYARRDDEAEHLRLAEAMIRNALTAATAGGALRHAAMVTGLSHYMGVGTEAPFVEEHPRGYNKMYFVQEDILMAFAAERGFTWSVARPGTILGYAPGNLMNLGTAVAVHAILSRETGRPFVFPGTALYYNGLADVTDARLLARHLVWEATNPAAANLAFNVTNGDLFRWKHMWAQIAEYFGAVVTPHPGHQTNLAALMADAEPDWKPIVRRYDLAPSSLAQIAPFWHMDLDLGRTADSMASMTRSRKLGFLDYQSTWDTFTDLFARLRALRLIP